MTEDIASETKLRVAFKADFLLEPSLLMRFSLAVEWVCEGRCRFPSQWLIWRLVMHPVLSIDSNIDRLRRLYCQNWQFILLVACILVT